MYDLYYAERNYIVFCQCFAVAMVNDFVIFLSHAKRWVSLSCPFPPIFVYVLIYTACTRTPSPVFVL